MKIKYLHTMIRVKNIEKSKEFYCNLLGLKELRRKDSQEGKYTLVFLAAPNQEDVALELTGRGNYGMKPKEVKIETDKSNSIFLTTEKDIKSYNIVLECYKETGFKEE